MDVNYLHEYTGETKSLKKTYGPFAISDKYSSSNLATILLTSYPQKEGKIEKPPQNPRPMLTISH